MMKTSSAGIAFVCDWEKFRPKPYNDGSGYLTWGFGHRHRGAEHIPEFVTEDEGRQIMAVDLQDAEAAVRRGITAPLTQFQFDALVSLAFNAGAAAVSPTSSHLARLVNSELYSRAALWFEPWDHSHGVEEPGLLKRRRAERKMFETGVYDSTH